ncbi:MAG: helix-turn-helix domain-containing protein [Dehalococcoidales bacterium]
MTEEPLVTISQASRLLGVSDATLRQWTDEGRLKAFITPGGHRRYAKADLRKLTSSQQRPLGVKDLVASLKSTAEAHREIGRASFAGTSWYGRLDAVSQEQLADQGRRLLRLIERYIQEPAKREETVELARKVGHENGTTLAGLGLALTESVEAFMLHREPIIKATTQLAKQKAPLNRRFVEATVLVHHVIDEALVALVAAHQQYRNDNADDPTDNPAHNPEGGTPE